MTSAAGLLCPVRSRVKFRKSLARMGTGDFTGIDESRAQRRTPQQNEQECNGRSKNSEAHSAPLGAQSWYRRTFGNGPATSAIRPRPAFASSARTGAAPAAFGFTRLGFYHWRALKCRPAPAAPIGTRAAGLAFGGVAANPLLVRPLIILRVKFGCWQLLAHRAPPEKANTKTMCSSVKIISVYVSGRCTNSHNFKAACSAR